MQVETTDRGQFATEHASRYLQQLLKHFAHKIEVQYDETSGRAYFPFGIATLTATPKELTVVLTAESSEALERGRGAIDRHLKTFAFREEFTTMNWAAMVK